MPEFVHKRSSLMDETLVLLLLTYGRAVVDVRENTNPLI